MRQAAFSQACLLPEHWSLPTDCFVGYRVISLKLKGQCSTLTVKSHVYFCRVLAVSCVVCVSLLLVPVSKATVTILNCVRASFSSSLLSPNRWLSIRGLGHR